jgi:hypothetical protein
MCHKVSSSVYKWRIGDMTPELRAPGADQKYSRKRLLKMSSSESEVTMKGMLDGTENDAESNDAASAAGHPGSREISLRNPLTGVLILNNYF